MKAIPTEYDGVKYKSRLEARWAMYFNLLQIYAEYEPFTIRNNGEEYVPDFHSVAVSETKRTIIEIKPKIPNSNYLDRLVRIHDPSKSDIIIFCGPPNNYHGLRIHNKRVRGVPSGVSALSQNHGHFLKICKTCGLAHISLVYVIGSEMYEDECPNVLIHNKNAAKLDIFADRASNFRFDL